MCVEVVKEGRVLASSDLDSAVEYLVLKPEIIISIIVRRLR
jgi:hypothetical protein